MGTRIKRADKRIRYHEHALMRMRERGVSHDNVAQTLFQPDAVRPAKTRKAHVFEKALSKRKRLKVVAEERPLEFWVISALWQ